MKFTAAVLTHTGRPLEIIDNIEVPALRSGQLLVRVLYAGVCHSQLMEVAGARGEDRYLPHMLGHEATAEIVDTGPDVSKFRRGDHIVLGWIKGTGIDAGGSVYPSPIGNINAGPVTTFGQFSVVSENRCYKLPHNIGLREGVLLGCALPTGMGMVNNQIHCRPENSIGVLGLGGIGMAALVAAITARARLIIAIDTNPEKLDLAKKIGAHLCINVNKQNAYEQIAELTGGNMLDYIVEAAGQCPTIEQAFSLINKTKGKCVFASHPPCGEKIRLDPFELICGKKIEGSWGGASNPDELVEEVAHQPDTEILKALTSNNYQLADINSAMADLREQRVVRAIINMNNGQ
jgi:S-(hydroxymethyl)glutathione dehydrogenase / alcohol dehydrogenase